MKDLEAFNILGIEFTKDKKVIKGAYVTLLPDNNPEENPEGFKLLRKAYEKALEYADREETFVVEKEAATPLGALKLSLQQIYFDFQKRINNEEWKKFLENDIFDDLDYSEDAKQVVLSFLCENFRLKNSTYRLIDDKFAIVENESEIKEGLPANFVDYMIGCIRADDDNDELFNLISGDKNCDYDGFIDKLAELDNIFSKNNYYIDVDEDTLKEQLIYLKELVEYLEHSGLSHPHYEMYKARLFYVIGQKDKALEIAGQFVNYPVNEDSIDFYCVALSVIFDCGDKNLAKQEFVKLLVSAPKCNMANRYVAKYYYYNQEYLKALEYYDRMGQANDVIIDEFGKCFEHLDENQYVSYHRLRGLYCYKSEKYKDAALELEKYNQEIEKNPEAKYDLVNNLVLLGKIYGFLSLQYSGDYNNTRITLMRKYKDKALQTYLDANKLADGNPQTKRLIILYAAEIENYDMVIEYGEEYIEEYPDDFAVLLKLQEAYFGQNMLQEVVDLFYRIIEIYDKNEWTYVYAAKAFMKYRQYNDAANIIEQASENGAGGMMLDVVEACIKSTSFDEIDEKISSFVMLCETAKKYDYLYKNFKADKNALNVLRGCEGNAEAVGELYYEIANLYIEYGSSEDFQEVKNYLTKSKAFHQSKKLEYTMVKWYQKNRDFGKAMEHCHLIGASYEYDFEVYMKMSDITTGIFDDKPEEYIELICKASQCAKDTPYYWRRLAGESMENAICRKWYSVLEYSNEWWDKLRQSDPGCNAEATYYMAQNCLFMLDYNGAVKFATESNNTQSTYVAMQLLARAYKKFGQFDKAIEILDSIEIDDEDDIDINFVIDIDKAKVYEAKGSYNNAIDIYEKYLPMPEEYNQTVVERLCLLYTITRDYRALEKTIEQYKIDHEERRRCVLYKYLNLISYSDELQMKMLNDLNNDLPVIKNDMVVDSDFFRSKYYYDDIYVMSDIYMLGMGDIFTGIKLKNNYVLQYLHKNETEIDNMELMDKYVEFMELKYFCGMERDVRGELGGINVLMNYHRWHTFPERYIIDRFVNDPNNTLKRISYAIKYCCYKGLFKKAFELIESKLQNLLNMVDYPVGEADYITKEAIAIYLETTGNEAAAMALYKEINQKYGISKLARLKAAGYCFNKYDLPDNFKESFGERLIKVKRIFLFMNEDDEDVLFVSFDKKTTVEERMKYGFSMKYTRGLARYVLPDGAVKDEILRVGKKVPNTNKIVSADEQLFEYIINEFTEQGIADTEANQIAELEKYLRTMAMQQMVANKESNNFNEEQSRMLVREMWDYAQKMYRGRTIKYTRAYKIVDRIVDDTFEMYDYKKELSEKDMELFMKGELRG